MARPTTPRRPASFEQADAGLTGVLADLEGAEQYTDWIISLFAPHLRGRILEVGAGQGTYSARLAAFGEVVAVEPSTAQCDVLGERLAGVAGTTVINGDLADVPAAPTFDAIVMINVLEHIPDDADAVRRCADLLSPGGHLLVWVPAFEALYGRFDHEIGHYRRYRRRPLHTLITSSNLRVDTLRHANLPGFFAWWLVVRVLRRRPTSGGLAGFYDRRLVPLIRRVEGRVTPPFGQSLLLIASKPAH
jgi:SAM-dependent methyltransferase